MPVAVRKAVEKFRGGDAETAFFELIDMPGEALPAILEIFRSETEPPVRAFLIKAAWERRANAVIPALAEALKDDAEEVWQEALDGRVAVAGADTLDILVQGRSRGFADPQARRRYPLWLEEAIQQVHLELRARS